MDKRRYSVIIDVHISKELTIMLTIIWWLQKLGKDCQ